LNRQGIAIRQGWAAVLALAALLCLAAVAPATALAGSVSGTVTDASTGEPIEGIEACAFPEGEEGGWECVFTEADGSYVIPELDPGEYFVEFWPGELGYRGEWFESILVGGGDTVVDAELVRKAAVRGTVIATEDGLPVEEVEVCAIDVVWNEYANCAWTGSDGTYSLPLYEGEFKIEFWPAPSGRNLALQFYDHQDRWNDAAVLSLVDGEWVSGVDADLGSGATLSGHVSNASGQPLEDIRVCSIFAPAGQLWICNWTNSAGNYSIRFHSPGDYKVVFSPLLTEFFPEAWPEDDGFPTEFWDNQTTLAAANLIGLSAGQSTGGINAALGTLPVSPPAFTPPAAKPPFVPPRKRKCRRGFRKKRVKGKVRCVKVRRRHHRRGDKSKRLAVPSRYSQVAVHRFAR
jgi:hypothetical protein